MHNLNAFGQSEPLAVEKLSVAGLFVVRRLAPVRAGHRGESLGLGDRAADSGSIQLAEERSLAVVVFAREERIACTVETMVELGPAGFRQLD